MRWLFVNLILLYRATLGPWFGGQCRFTPSCSQYALDAIQKYGPLPGAWRALKRIARCHPGSRGGIDEA